MKHIQAFQVLALLIFLSLQTDCHLFPPYHELPPPIPPPPIPSYPLYAPHAKIIPHILAPTILAAAAASNAQLDLQHSFPPIAGETFVITVHTPSTVSAHRETPFLLQQSGSQTFPYKLIFSQFPPIVEGVVQRVQNYFSTYLGRPGQFPQDIRPATYPPNSYEVSNFPTNSYPNFPTATIPTITTTPFSTTTSTTMAPLLSITTKPTDADSSSPDISTKPQTPSSGTYTSPDRFETPSLNKLGNTNGSYKYDSPTGRAFPYPKPSFERFTNKDILYSKLQ